MESFHKDHNIMIILFVLLGFFLSVSTPTSLPDTFNREKTIEFYQHIIRTNASSLTSSEVPIGGGDGPAPGRFGYAVVFDHKLTEENDYYSTEVGRVRGAGVVASLDGTQAHETFTVSLAGRNGAISCVGAFELRQPVSRIPCVGGSGEFYRMEGVFTSQVVQSSGGNAVAHVQLTIRNE